LLPPGGLIPAYILMHFLLTTKDTMHLFFFVPFVPFVFFVVNNKT